jgi:F-type H+-transporting ATPase subunit alpha
MDIRADEISRIIKDKIGGASSDQDLAEVGSVLSVGDGIARVYGLGKVALGELIEFQNGTKALAFNLEEDNVGAVVMGDTSAIAEGDTVRRTGQIAQVPVGEALIGRVVDALGNPIDGLGDITTPHKRRVEIKAPGIVGRKSVHEPMQTGLKAIDAMTPVGQRRNLYLRRHRPEAFVRCSSSRATQGARRDGPHDRCVRHSV